MKLADVSNGPDWVVWVVLVLLVIFSIILLTGHGSWLIAGYNTSSKEEKAKYNEKRLCRIVGSGMMIVSVLVFISQMFENVLPASFAYWMLGIIFLDVVVMLILGNTIGKK